MCNSTETKRFADNYEQFFHECFIMNKRLDLTRDHYCSNLSFLFNMFDESDDSDFYSTADKKKFISELITSIKECQSCISKLSIKIQQLADLTDDDYKKSSKLDNLS